MTLDIHGDRALRPDELDRLGFREIAEKLALTLSTETAADGAVIGIVGQWGAGKSSLLNMVRDELEKISSDEKPHIMEFQPWLVGQRDALLRSLFAELAAGIDELEYQAGDATGKTLRKLSSSADAVRELGSHLDPLSSAIKAAGILVPGLGTFGAFIGNISKIIPQKSSPSLNKLKRKATARLKKLDRTLIVIIDDLDRLEPSETIEVLRLVRSVADFPNVIYVLCYDSDVLHHAIEVAADVQDGKKYLEKIVQIIFPVPAPEAFDLRRWFLADISKLDIDLSFDDKTRLSQVVDIDGGRYLTTPRAVIRCLNAIRFSYKSSEKYVDFPDFVWLQLLKVGNFDLFCWVRDYLTSVSARSIGRTTISKEDILKDRRKLDIALERENATFSELCGRLADMLPGVTYYQDPESTEIGIYEDVIPLELTQAILNMRLASPDHYKVYFSFAPPNNTPLSSDYENLWAAYDHSPTSVESLLLEWSDQTTTSGVTKAEIILDRVFQSSDEILDEVRSVTMFTALANVLDVIGNRTVTDLGGPDIWRRADKLLPRLFAAFGSMRSKAITSTFSEGGAIEWLNSVFRRELFAHGRAGDRPTRERLFSEEELDTVSGIMIERFRKMEFADFAKMGLPLSVWFGWSQAGDLAGPRDLLAKESIEDEGLLRVLEAMSGVVYAGGPHGTYRYTSLSRSNVDALLDFDTSRSRVESLCSSDDLPAELKKRATAVLKAFKHGERFN